MADIAKVAYAKLELSEEETELLIQLCHVGRSRSRNKDFRQRVDNLAQRVYDERVSAKRRKAIRESYVEALREYLEQ